MNDAVQESEIGGAGGVSAKRLAEMIEHGEKFHAFNRDDESAELLAALRELQALRIAAGRLWHKYAVSEDEEDVGPLSCGFTNGDFFALRDALVATHKCGNVEPEAGYRCELPHGHDGHHAAVLNAEDEQGPIPERHWSATPTTDPRP